MARLCSLCTCILPLSITLLSASGQGNMFLSPFLEKAKSFTKQAVVLLLVSPTGCFLSSKPYNKNLKTFVKVPATSLYTPHLSSRKRL